MGFASLNRYREKCFIIMPVMRERLQAGTLTGPARELMDPLPYEQLYDTEADAHEIRNLANSPVAGLDGLKYHEFV